MVMRALAGARLTAHAEIFESALSKFPRFVYKDKKFKKKLTFICQKIEKNCKKGELFGPF
jgi:hypothetical protein